MIIHIKNPSKMYLRPGGAVKASRNMGSPFPWAVAAARYTR